MGDGVGERSGALFPLLVLGGLGPDRREGLPAPHVHVHVLPLDVLFRISMNSQNVAQWDGEVTFEQELSYNNSYFQVRNLGTLVTSVTVTTIKS